ncbi:hypothetical protein SB60_22490 [Salmonella enterica subsp. enterica serovar Muenchen]|nr:hypothetical protein [Salmonella enterica subsp. enterica serovar Muenchen]
MKRAIINLNNKILLSDILKKEIDNKIEKNYLTLHNYITNGDLFKREDFNSLLERRMHNLGLYDETNFSKSFKDSLLINNLKRYVDDMFSYTKYLNLEHSLQDTIQDTITNEQVLVSEEDFKLTNDKIVNSIRNNNLTGFHCILHINTMETAVYYVSNNNDIYENIEKVQREVIDSEREKIEKARLDLLDIKSKYYDKFNKGELDILINPVLLNEFLVKKENEVLTDIIDSKKTSTKRRL